MSRWARNRQPLFRSIDDIPAHLRAPWAAPHEVPPSISPTKYGNRRTFFQGRWFDSKAEAERFGQQLLRVSAGELLGVIPQISIPLPSGKHRMRLDFGLVGLDGRILLADEKGFVTDLWQLKHDECAAKYGVKIELFR